MSRRNATVAVAVPPVEELYPHRAVIDGVLKAGLTLLPNAHQVMDADILVTWSPWKRSRRGAIFQAYKDSGRLTIVMENGWLSPVHFPPVVATSYYQVAFDGWNGTGTFPAGDRSRWFSWTGARLRDWTNHSAKRGNAFALVIGQRGHPFDERSSPPAWHETFQPPGIDPSLVVRRPRDCAVPLANQLGAAGEVHVWTSNAASHAILAGVPVVQHGPNLMVSHLASRPGEPLRRPDRDEEFERLAWAQFSAAEIATGMPFNRLLEMSHNGLGQPR